MKRHVNSENFRCHSALESYGDEELMREVQSGNGDALTVIFKRYQRLVLVTALRILRDLGEAEDLMQSVFFEIYCKAAQFDPARGSLSNWILQYAYHRSISRKNYLTVRHFYEGFDKQTDDSEEVWTTLGAQPGQDAAMIAKEALALLERAAASGGGAGFLCRVEFEGNCRTDQADVRECASSLLPWS